MEALSMAVSKEKRERVSATPDELYEIFAGLEEPTINNTIAEFRRLYPDRKVSLSSAKKWSSSYEWFARLGAQDPDKLNMTDAQKLQALCKQLAINSRLVTPEAVKGMQGKLLDRIIKDIKELRLDSIEKVEAALEVVSMMMNLEHDLRGNTIRNKKDDAAADGDESSAPTNNVIDYSVGPTKSLRSQVRS